jgi:CRISPR/Cas system-associated protein Cas7 (RAMP superfamily)
MDGACNLDGEGRDVYRVLVGKPEEKRPLGRPRGTWEDNIKMDLLEVGCGSIDWIGLVQDRDRWRALVNAVMNLRVPYNAGNFLTSCEPVSFSRRIMLHGVSK